MKMYWRFQHKWIIYKTHRSQTIIVIALCVKQYVCLMYLIPNNRNQYFIQCFLMPSIVWAVVYVNVLLCYARNHNIRALTVTKDSQSIIGVIHVTRERKRSSACSIVYFELFKIGIESSVWSGISVRYI